MAATDRLSDASFVPLSTLDPVAARNDLEPFARLIDDDVRVVAIGESAHGAREFYALRDRLIRFLIERLNFTALAWEAGFPEAFIVDDYIHGRRADRERVQADGMTMHMGRCEEFGGLLDWLRAHNAARAGSVHFYGLDLPGSIAVLRPALEVVRAYVDRVDPGFHARFARLGELTASFGAEAPAADTSKLTLPGTATVHQYVAMPAADRNELTALLADAAVRFDALRRAYVERSDEARYDLARQHRRVPVKLDLQLRAVAALMAGDAAACEANIRDLTMADTLEWVLRRHERVVVLAHNGHIQKTPISTMAGMTPVDTLGVHLAHRLRNRYLAVATTCGSGEVIAPRTTTVDGKMETDLVIKNLPSAGPDTIDGLLDTQLGRTALLDLRRLDPQAAPLIDGAKKMRVQDTIIEIDVRRSFDLLVHIPRISLWTSSVNRSLPDVRAGGVPAC